MVRGGDGSSLLDSPRLDILSGETASEKFLAVRWLKAFKNQACLKSPSNLFSVTGTHHPSVPPSRQ